MKKKFRKTGFTLLEMMMTIGIIGLVAAIAIPGMVRARSSYQASHCINNLNQIVAAVNQFSMDHAMPAGTNVSYPNDLTPYIKLTSANLLPSCPAKGTYTISYVGAIPLCSLGNSVTPPHVLQ